MSGIAKGTSARKVDSVAEAAPRRGRGRPRGSRNRPREGVLADQRPNGIEDRIVSGLDARIPAGISERRTIEIHRTVLRDPRRPYPIAETLARVRYALDYMLDVAGGRKYADPEAIEFRYADAFECLSWLRQGALDVSANVCGRAQRLRVAATKNSSAHPNKNIRKA